MWSINVPSHRFDIEREVDLIEEVCRVRGYHRIPVRMPTTRLELGRLPLDQTPRGTLKRLLASLGYQEAITYSFIDPTLSDLLDPGATTVSLTNPMSQDMSQMRTTVWPGLIKTLIANASRQQTRVRLFELGRCFRHDAAELTQPIMLGGILWGERLPENWANERASVDFFDLKGDVERVLEHAGFTSVRYQNADDPVLHPGQSATVWSGETMLGRLGRLHPELEHRLDLEGAGVPVRTRRRKDARPPTPRASADFALSERAARPFVGAGRAHPGGRGTDLRGADFGRCDG